MEVSTCDVRAFDEQLTAIAERMTAVLDNQVGSR